MKFKINRNVFLQNLNNVSKGLSNKPQMPILTGIKIDVRERYILLTSSNFDISIQAKISNTEVFDIEEQGTVVLPGKYYKNGDWDLWIDGFGWSGDSGYKPYYWCELPPFPPLPYEGPYCEYYKGEYCSAQKNTPRCVCQGNRKVCMYFD